MQTQELIAEKRAKMGSRESRRLRREGRLPVNLYDIHSNLILSTLKAIDRLNCGDDPEVVTAVRKLTDSDGEGSADVRAKARDVLARWDEKQGA